MIRTDAIVEEIHAVRDAIARASDFDIDKMLEAARTRQTAEGREIVAFSGKKPVTATKAS